MGTDQAVTDEDWDEVRDGWDDLSKKEQYLLTFAYQMYKGRKFETTTDGNFFKRWTDINDKPYGFEFRPLLRADYGYPDDFQTYVSWANMAVQTLAMLKTNVKRGLLMTLVAVGLNDFVRPMVKDGIGASFVWNMQAGYNLYHGLRNKRKLQKYAAWGALGVDAAAIAYEKQLGFDFNEIVGSDVHAAALALGWVYGLVEKRFR
jgi:hypothetical protein